MAGIFDDIRYSFRTLRNRPMFTMVAIATLGLGIGANTAIFSVVDTVMLRPLDFRRPDQLVEINALDARTGERSDQLSFPNYRDLRSEARTLSSTGTFRYWLFNVSGADHPESHVGVYVGDSLFETLGVRPALGRLFALGADKSGYPPEVVLSDALWRMRFGADPHVVGTNALIDGRPMAIVGVLPRDFRFPDLIPAAAPLPSRAPGLYAPLSAMTDDDREERGNNNYWVLARMRDGTTLDATRADLARVGRDLARDHPAQNEHLALQPVGLQRQMAGDAGQPLLILFGAVAMVLFIACANVGGLLLARAVERRREIGIRTALGASPGRLARQLLTESLVLGLGGGVVGVVLAAWGVDALRAVAPNSIPRIDEITINARVLVFAFLGAVVTGLLFGLVPIFQQRAAGPAGALRESGRGSGGRATRRLRSGLVIGQVALAVLLLSGAGLLLRSFASLSRVKPGFDADNVMTMFTLVPPARYPTDSSRTLFEQRALAALNLVPGVTSASLVNTLPLSNLGNSTTMEAVGHPAVREADRVSVDLRTVDGAYFRTMGIPIIRGRDFTQSDNAQSSLVVVLNDAAARQFFPGEDAVGHQVRIFNGDLHPRTVVGVVGDVHTAALDQPAKAEVTLPFSQGPDVMISLAIRTRGDSHTLLPAIRRALAGVDASQAFYAERTMGDLVTASLEARRFNLEMLGAFAVLALTLAAVGLYGVIAFSVSQRTREIGIRSALGAERGRIAALVLREGAGLGLAGLLLGLAAALATTRLLRGLLFHVSPGDPLTLGVVVIFLAVVILLASYVPARRAMRVDPVEALRVE